VLRIVNKKKRLITEFLDKIGYGIFKPVSLFWPKRRDTKKIKKILAVRTAYIGDVVLTIPAIKLLSERFPQAKISFLTCSTAKNALEKNPYINEIMTYDAPWFYPRKRGSILSNYVKLIKMIRYKKFDMAIDFRGDFRDILMIVFPSHASRKVGYGITGGGYLLTDVVACTDYKHKVEFHLDIVRSLGCNSTPDIMNLYPTAEDRSTVEKLLQEMGIKRGGILVGIQPGGRVKLKCWDIKYYAEVADALIERYGANIVITGGPDEVEIGESLLRLMKRKGFNLCGKLSLRQLQALMGEMQLFITNDTASLHIASGANVPTVAIFGPSEVWDTGPLSQIHKVIIKNMPCRATCDTYRCHNKNYHECLKSITPTEVKKACVDLLESMKMASW
jgi:lipopolysaccharide heptosyltransferase II